MAQQPKQAIGGGVEQQPELIGQEAMETQAIGLDLQLQFLDAVLHVAPEHIDVVIDKLGGPNQVGDHEALIAPRWVYFTLAMIRRGWSQDSAW